MVFRCMKGKWRRHSVIAMESWRIFLGRITGFGHLYIKRLSLCETYMVEELLYEVVEECKPRSVDLK